MIIQTNIGGKIVADESLIMYLDASNPESYPGSGNTWYDLTNYRSHGTMDEALFVPGTPSYMHINNNGVGGNNLGVGFQAPVTSNTVTVDMWMKMPQGWGIWLLFGWYSYFFGFFSGASPGGSNSELGWGSGGGDFRYLTNSTISGNPGSFSNWNNITMVMNINTSYTNNKGYINSTLYSQGGDNITVTTFNSGQGRIGTWNNPNNFYYSTFYCGLVRLYNRELTQSEITQNYNAMKSRFGIF